MIIIAFASIIFLLVSGAWQLRGRVIFDPEGRRQKLSLFRALEVVALPSIGSGFAVTFLAWTCAFGLNLNSQSARDPTRVDAFARNLATFTPPVFVLGQPLSFDVSPSELAISLFAIAIVIIFKELRDYEETLEIHAPPEDSSAETGPTGNRGQQPHAKTRSHRSRHSE